MFKGTKEKKSFSNNKICVIICSVLLLIALVFLLYRLVKPFYKVESRVGNFAKEENNRSEKMIGWIKVQGTNIDYPVILEGTEKDIMADLKYKWAWTNQATTEITNRPIILGHNILNLSSHPSIANKNHSGFEQLLSFVYPSFLKDNKYIQYTVGGKDYLYKIFSVTFTTPDISHPFENYFKKEDLQSYIKRSKEDSYFDFDVDVADNDAIITLVTCTRFFGGTGYSFKIDARLVRNGEIISNYGFKEKKNYNKIKEILKGDEANEKA